MSSDQTWPAVPLPLYGLLHIRCYECGRPFWDLTSPSLARNSSAFRHYERHYRRAHSGELSKDA